MPIKKDAISKEEKFFLNLSDETYLSLDYNDFNFVLQIPSLLAEATLSLESVNVAQIILQNPEYKNLLDKIKLPKFVDKAETITEQDIQIEQIDLDITKISHVRYALRNLPDEFINTLNNIAYLNITVKEIKYKSKEIWIQNNDDELLVSDFLTFVKHVRMKNLRVGILTDYLLNRYLDWLEEIEISPQEVKN